QTSWKPRPGPHSRTSSAVSGARAAPAAHTRNGGPGARLSRSASFRHRTLPTWTRRSRRPWPRSRPGRARRPRRAARCSAGPLTGLHLAACLEEGGLPTGVFNIVVGRGSEVGTPLVEHPNVKAISFTGSVAVGLQVRGEATALGKRVQLELGGHNPLIVMADA